MSVYPIFSEGTHFDVRRLLTSIPELEDPVQAFADLEHDISPAHPVQYVLGGFGAAGLPSLFHHPMLRDLRLRIFQKMLPIFQEQFPGNHIRMLMDRFSIRRKGTSLGGESWHRDIGGDRIFGGWINLDTDANQAFTCVFGSEINRDSDRGFVKFSKEQMARLETQKTVVQIPPGHLIVFDQTIAHKITAVSRQPATSFRLYVGWQVSAITDFPPQLDPILAEHLRLQTAPPLPSGQRAPMYAKLHWTNWRPMLQDFAMTFHIGYRCIKTVKSGSDAGQEVNVVQDPMFGCHMNYPPYLELDLYPLIGCVLPSVPPP